MDIFLYMFVFLLAALLGFELISKVPPTLHTPLMSGSNAISGITIVGAIMCSGLTINETGQSLNPGFFAESLAFLAITFATINVVGGYTVTDRMLASFKSKKKKGGK